MKTKAQQVRAMDDVKYAAEWTKLQDLHGRLSALDREFQTLQARMAEDDYPERRDAQALALLDGDDVGPSATEDLRSRLDAIWSERQTLRRAIVLQERRTAEALASASKEIAQERLPAYRDLLQKMADTAAELGRLGDEEQAFRDRLREGGVNFTSSIRPMPINGFTLRDEHTRLRLWLKELAKFYDITPRSGK